MQQQTPPALTEAQTPFDVDGAFNTEKAISLAFEQRALGDIDAADDLDLLVNFFITSQNYVLSGTMKLEQEIGTRVVPVIYPGASI